MSKARVNIDVMVDAVRGYVDGTGLQVAIVIWRPGFSQRGETVAYGSTSHELRETADAMMTAVDLVTADMKVEGEAR